MGVLQWLSALAGLFSLGWDGWKSFKGMRNLEL